MLKVLNMSRSGMPPSRAMMSKMGGTLTALRSMRASMPSASERGMFS